MKKFLSLLMILTMLLTFGVNAEELSGEAQGFGGPIQVTIIKDGDKITEVKIFGDSETAGIGSNAIEEMPARIVEANGVNVDVVAGATISSNAIIEATKMALGESVAAAEGTEEENLDGATIGISLLTAPKINMPRKEGDSTSYGISQFVMAVLFDKNGRIAYSYADSIDVASPNGPVYNQKFTGWPNQSGMMDAENNAVVQTEEGFIAEIPALLTKRQLGDNYMMPSGSWANQMDRFQELFNGKTIAEVEEWIGKYTSDTTQHPLTDKLEDEADIAKYNTLSDEEKTMLADVTSSATMSLNNIYGSFIKGLKKAYENRVSVNQLENAYFGFGMKNSGRVGPGKDSKEIPVYSLNQVIAAVLFDKDGKILDAHIDQLEVATPNYDGATMPHFSGYPGNETYSSDLDHDGVVDETAPEITEDSFKKEFETWATKRQRGESYKLASGTWTEEMNAYEDFFVGKTVAELEDWFEKYTASNGRPLKAEQKKEEDQQKYDALSDEEKMMLADVTSSATMSLNDSHGDILGAIKMAYENRIEANITLGK